MKYNTLEETELWHLIAKGNQNAFAYIYTTYSKDMYKYGHKFTQETELIEDVIQDVYVHIWELRNSLTVKKSIKFYLFSSFRRELIKRINASYESETLEDYHSNISWQASFQEILLENQITLESSKKVTQALENLSARQKEAIFLRYIQDLSYEEISALMEIQVPSLYNLIFKGIKTMKEFLSSSKFTAKAIAVFFMLIF
ncbi:MAG: sigma-70 family RNA polymerase sigma factor [Anditalea sp.]